MNKLIASLILFVVFQGFGQRVKIMDISPDYFRHNDVSGFYCLHPEIEKEAYEWIATVKVTFDSIYPNTLTNLYDKLTDKSNRLRANAFRFRRADIFTTIDEKYIELDVYYLKMERRDLNYSLFDKNKVYLFGFLGYHQNIEGYTIEINGEQLLLSELRYKEISLPAGVPVEIKLDKGVKADVINLTGTKDMKPVYYEFDIFKGMFTRSKITTYDINLAEFLKPLLKREVYPLKTKEKE